MTKVRRRIMECKISRGSKNAKSVAAPARRGWPGEAQALPNGARAIMSSRVQPKDDLDYSPTPPWATRALIERVFPILGVRDLASVWEPACGEGHMAEVLREFFAEVTATDVFDYGYGDAEHDFLD
jgi:hypothetical protein